MGTGADKVVETDAKAVLITNTGLDLLGVVAPRSPLLSLVLQSVKVGLRPISKGRGVDVSLLHHNLTMSHLDAGTCCKLW